MYVTTGQIQSQQKELDELQETARQQLVNLAAQGESAVSVAQGQLLKAHQMVDKFHRFIKVHDCIMYSIYMFMFVSFIQFSLNQCILQHNYHYCFFCVSQVLSDGLLAKQQTFRLQKQRRVREERRKERLSRRGEDEALTQAKRRAQEILSLTMSDIDDILDSDEEDEYGDDEDEVSVRSDRSGLHRRKGAITSCDQYFVEYNNI